MQLNDWLTRIPLVSPYGDLAQRKSDYWRTNEDKNLKKIANPQAFSVEQFVFSVFLFQFSNYSVLEAKCVGNWKSEILWWAHHPVRETKLQNFALYRLWSLGMRCAYAPHAPPPPTRFVLPATTCPRHATETHWTYQWEIGCLVDGVGEDTSHVHAPRFPYRLGIIGTVWGFGWKEVWPEILDLSFFSWIMSPGPLSFNFFENSPL